MTIPHEYRAMQGSDVDRVAWLLSQAFGSPIERAVEWVNKFGHDEFRVMARPGAAADACLLLIPMGLFIGGRSVPQLGVAAVSTSPESRGGGVAKGMMRESVLETARRGVPLGVLFPATQTLYRRVGYEQAASHFMVTIDLTRLRAERADRALAMRRLTVEDRPVIEGIHRERTRSSTGELDRGAYIWRRIYEPRVGAAEGWCVEEHGEITGWVFVTRCSNGVTLGDAYPYSWLSLADVQAFTPNAARRILAMLADENSIWKAAKMFCGPHHPLLAQVAERCFTMTLADYPMVRIASVAGALEARGWPVGMSGSIAIEIADDLIEANNGWFTLRVDGGAGTVVRERGKPAGVASLSMSIRDLAMMYTGFAPARSAAVGGTVRGDERALEIAGALFAGSHPGMMDQF
jgi:predicted acetyltransferase